MRNLYRLVTLSLVAVACNEALGLDPGKPEPDETGGTVGTSGSAGDGGTGMVGSGTGGSATNGGSGPAKGGASGEAGDTSSGGVAGSNGGRGGNSGSGGDTGESGAAGMGGRGSCSSLECREQGYDLCLNGSCAKVTTDDCNILLGTEWIDDHPEDEPFIFGALGRFDIDIHYYPAYWNLKLAMQEVSEYGPIPIEGSLRRPVLLLCSGPASDTNIEPLRDSLDHMTELGVSSILMLLTSRSEVQALVDRTLNDRGEDVFFLDIGGATGGPAGGGLLNLADNGRLWHMRGDTYSLIFPFVPLVERLEELVNPGASTGNAAEPTRLVVVAGTTDEYDQEIMQTLSDFPYSPLRLNGMVLRYQPGQAHAVPGNLGGGIGEGVAEFEPHIVLDFSDNSALELVVDEAFVARGLPPPFYVLPPHGARSQTLLDHIAEDPSLRRRVVGLDFASADDPTLYRAYLERLRSIVPDALEIRNLGAFPNVYDAMYFLIYSAAAGGRGGTAKAVGFRRLLLGPQREIGPDGIQSVLSRLSPNPDATLSLSGPSGDFGFHVPTGGRIAFANVWCVDENLEYVMDVLRYDRDRDDFTGALTCFDP